MQILSKNLSSQQSSGAIVEQFGFKQLVFKGEKNCIGSNNGTFMVSI